MSAPHPSETSPTKAGHPDKRERPVLALVSPSPLPAGDDVTEVRSDLRRLITEAIALFRQGERDEHDMQIVTSIPERFPLLPVHPLRLRQVLRMLLRLAATSMPSGGELEVAAESAPQDRAGPCIQVVIRTRDTLPVAETTTSRDQLRSGLTAARSLAESFGGQIHCRTRQHAVPEFVVLVPRH